MKLLHPLILLMAALSMTVVGVCAASDVASRHRAVLEEVAAAAEEGDPEALYRMYTIYSRGFDSIPADSVKALEMLRKAAEAGHSEAQNYLGYRLYKGDGVAPDRQEALMWLEQSAANGNLRAAGNLGYLLLHGKGIVHDYANAAFWLEKAAAGEVATAQSMLGDLYRDGQGVERNVPKADSLYREAFANGLTDAAYKIQSLHEQDWKCLDAASQREEGLRFYLSGAPDVAVGLFEMAAERGDSRAMALLGDAYTRGLGVGYNHQKALDRYAQAAAAGDPSAMFFIAELLEILPDSLDTLSPEVARQFDLLPHDAPSWFERAAQAGVTDAANANARLLSPR